MTPQQLALEPVPPITAGTSRRSDRWTSQQAAKSVQPGPDQRRCLDALVANGGTGTIDTVCAYFASIGVWRDRGPLSRRLTDLADMGLIKAGEPVMGSRGRYVTDLDGGLVSGFTLPLPDGSLATVESTGSSSSLISRSVDGVTVWGQVFARREDHAGQVREVLDAMAEQPEDFRRWWLS